MSDPFHNHTQPMPGGQPVPPPVSAAPAQHHIAQGYQQQPMPAYSQPPGYAQPYPAQPGMPPIVINNVANSTANAYAGGFRGHRKKQSFMVHLVLLFFTAGLGNIIYAWYVMDWNKKHGI